ncbi:MAG: flagellar hook assembly protein FlgD [Phycisphaerae bacterium]
MENITATTATATPGRGATGARSFADLGTEDFLSLLITQLRTQDPLEPMGNQELLGQLASVREIELSTTLTDSLRNLTGQQGFGSASSLIGKYVTGVPAEDGTARSGTVVGVRFVDGGKPVLRLSDGGELPMAEVLTIQSPLQAAEALIGQGVVGVDRRSTSSDPLVTGVVTGVRRDGSGEVLVELDAGQDLRFRDVVRVAPVDEV